MSYELVTVSQRYAPHGMRTKVVTVYNDFLTNREGWQGMHGTRLRTNSNVPERCENVPIPGCLRATTLKSYRTGRLQIKNTSKTFSVVGRF